MSNDILLAEHGNLAASSVQQTGTNNVHIENLEGGVINLNITHPSINLNAEKLIAIQKFSKDFYQLIVTCEDDIFTNNMVSVSTTRALTKGTVPDEIFVRCSSLGDAGVEELKTFPAIICQENTNMHGKADDSQMAILAYIKHIKKAGKAIKIVFNPLSVFPQKFLCDKRNAVLFDLNMECAITDLNRSAWSVHKINLFDAFDEAGLPNIPRPM